MEYNHTLASGVGLSRDVSSISTDIAHSQCAVPRQSLLQVRSWRREETLGKNNVVSFIPSLSCRDCMCRVAFSHLVAVLSRVYTTGRFPLSFEVVHFNNSGATICVQLGLLELNIAISKDEDFVLFAVRAAVTKATRFICLDCSGRCQVNPLAASASLSTLTC